jgi:hypothetical protein
MANSARGGNEARNAPAPAATTYGDFTTTHLPLFTEVREPLEDDHWLRVMESKFRLLHCTKVQKTIFTAQQLRGWPTTPPLTPRTTKCRGLSYVMLFAPTTSQQA